MYDPNNLNIKIYRYVLSYTYLNKNNDVISTMKNITLNMFIKIRIFGLKWFWLE